MSYIQGFVLAVPATNKQAYIDHAASAVALFREFGATRIVETWGDDVPDGQLTDFRRAVLAEEDEVVVFSWLEWPSRAVCDAGKAAMMTDPRMAALGEMPFDGQRMIFAGFVPIVDDRVGGDVGYVDGLLVPVASSGQEAYRALAITASAVFRDHGATQVVEGWGDAIADGKVTDFRRAVQARADENVVFSWVAWPSKAARDAGMTAVMADERMARPADLPFDGKRLVYGGFAPILDA